MPKVLYSKGNNIENNEKEKITKRRKLYTDTIAFPASKDAGTAIDIESDVMYDYEVSPGALNLHVVADDSSKITDNLSVVAKVSYDEGTSWKTAATYTDLANGTGAISAFKEEVVKYAPRVKLLGSFDASGALAASHGCEVFAELREAGNELRYQVDTDVVTVPTTVSVAADVAATGVLTLTGVVEDGETVSIGSDVYEFAADAAQTVTGSNIAVDITSYATASEGTLTVDTQPTAGQAFTIGDETFTFVEPVDFNEDGEVSVGTDLPTAQAAIVAAINGTDGENAGSSYVTAAAFNTNVSILTAITAGTSGDTIATTTTMDGGSNGFDDANLGTETAGVDCSAANAITTLVSAVTASDTEGVGAADGEGDTVDFEADIAGAAGNAITTTTTISNGAFSTANLTGGSDSVDVETVGDTINVDENVQKVVVISTADASKLTDITFKLQSSNDGNDWWDASTEVDISSSNFLETEITNKLGTYFKVILIADEDTGAAISGHGINFDLMTFYA